MNFESLTSHGFVEDHVSLDQHSYHVFRRQTVFESDEAPRLAVVSYLPTQETITILKLCIATIKKFTDTPYELWIADNNSPLEHLAWLIQEPNINLIVNRTNPKETIGSYANAIGLELVAHYVSPDTQYLMTLHQDTAPCKKGWLAYLLAKFDDQTRAVGVREDTTRVPKGILHVLGYVVDFQLFKQLGLSFYPDVPAFDVGDKVTDELRNHGYRYFKARNTLWEPGIADEITNGDHFKKLRVDRSLDDDGNVFFLHLGRGVAKSQGEYLDTDKSIGAWSQFINDYLLHPASNIQEKVNDITNKLYLDPWYSFRRYYVDKFFIENIQIFPEGADILDIGGKKKNKRGEFDIEQYTLHIQYANIDEQTTPDFLCDILEIPVPDNNFDGIILSEVLEHVPKPYEALQEAYRILKPGGQALITTPFMFHVHADPHDYYRYTDYWYKETLQQIGFGSIKIYKHGLFPSLLANLLKNWAFELRVAPGQRQTIKKKLFYRFVRWFSRKAIKLEQDHFYQDNWKLAGHTTGFGIICTK